MKTVKIAHLTSVHNRYDTRIFFKECVSLKNFGFDVTLIVADGLGNENKNNIKIFDVNKEFNRLDRVLLATQRIYRKAIELNYDIYHIHDPELIPIGLKLLKLNKKVIFDVHENIPLQIKTKEYLPQFVRQPLSLLYKTFEKNILHKFTGLVLAENSYVTYYSKLNKNYEVILNMPHVDKLEKYINFNRQKNHLFYIGSVSNQRGFKKTLQAIKILKYKIPDIYFHCIGPYNENLLNLQEYQEVKDYVKLYGRLPLDEGLKIAYQAKIGLSILEPIPNYIQSFSTKIFEYLAIGLPVITSNFPIYKEIIEKNNCGICIDPDNPLELANAIQYIFENKVEAKKMAINGKRIVDKCFNWTNEEKKLIKFYNKIICKGP